MSVSVTMPSSMPSPLYQLVEELREGVILLGTGGELRWANAAALAMHAVTDIAALGHDMKAYWQRFMPCFRHSSDTSRAPIDRLLGGEPFDEIMVDITLQDQEHTQRVHCIRGRVLAAAHDNDIAALIIEDITELISAEERFEKSFNANPAPALICRLADQRFTRVNEGFLEMTGLSQEEVVGRSIYELDVFAGATHREQVIHRLSEGLVIPQTEAVLHTSSAGHSKCVVVAGQPIEVSNSACLLLTFTDLEPTRRAQDALRRSEAQFSTIFHMSPVPTALADRENLALIEVNDAFNTTFVHDPAVPATGSLEKYALLSPDTRRRIIMALEKKEVLRGLESEMTNQRGEQLTCLISALVVRIEEKECILLTLVDITQRKRSEAELFTAIDTVMQDASWFTRTLVEKLSSVRHTGNTVAESAYTAIELSTREREVLSLLCQGMSDKRIAAQLSLAHSTVRNYTASLYRKLDVHSRSEAIVRARQMGLEELDIGDHDQW